MNSSRGIRFGAFAASVLAFSLAAGPGRAASSALIYTNGISSGWTPTSVSIDPGGTVTWENRDTEYEHPVECVQQDSNATCPWSGAKDLPKKPQIGSAPRVSVGFPNVGTFAFRCAIHTNMTGTVVVGSGHPPTTSKSSSAPRQSQTARATVRATTSQSVAPSASARTSAKATPKTSVRSRATVPSPSLSGRALGSSTTPDKNGPSAGATIPAALLIALVASAHVVRARRRSV